MFSHSEFTNQRIILVKDLSYRVIRGFTYTDFDLYDTRKKSYKIHSYHGRRRISTTSLGVSRN